MTRYSNFESTSFSFNESPIINLKSDYNMYDLNFSRHDLATYSTSFFAGLLFDSKKKPYFSETPASLGTTRCYNPEDRTVQYNIVSEYKYVLNFRYNRNKRSLSCAQSQTCQKPNTVAQILFHIPPPQFLLTSRSWDNWSGGNAAGSASNESRSGNVRLFVLFLSCNTNSGIVPHLGYDLFLPNPC
jgi:hypothetical protein